MNLKTKHPGRIKLAALAPYLTGISIGLIGRLKTRHQNAPHTTTGSQLSFDATAVEVSHISLGIGSSDGTGQHHCIFGLCNSLTCSLSGIGLILVLLRSTGFSICLRRLMLNHLILGLRCSHLTSRLRGRGRLMLLPVTRADRLSRLGYRAR